MKYKIVSAIFTWLVCLGFVLTGLYSNIDIVLMYTLFIIYATIALSFIKLFKNI